MGLATLHRQFDSAAPRLHAVRDRHELRPSAGSALPTRGVPLRATPRVFSRWLRDVSLGARSQRLSFRGLLGTPLTLLPSEPRMSERDALLALARVNRAVRADLLAAGRSRSQGELRVP